MLVAVRYVDGGLSGRDPSLHEVIGDDGLPDRHVFDDLVHRRDIVEGVLRVGRKADIRGREDADDLLVRDSPGERHVVGEAEIIGEPTHRREYVAIADEDRAPVAATPGEGMQRSKRVVDAILRAHDTEVRDKEVTPASEARVW